MMDLYAALPQFHVEGLSWNVPRLTYGLNLDYSVANAVALTGGLSASTGDNRQHASTHLGLGRGIG